MTNEAVHEKFEDAEVIHEMIRKIDGIVSNTSIKCKLPAVLNEVDCIPYLDGYPDCQFEIVSIIRNTLIKKYTEYMRQLEDDITKKEE